MASDNSHVGRHGSAFGGRHQSIGHKAVALFLTFDGLREAKVRDRDTRIRIALRGPLAAWLWRLLGERLTDEEKAS